MFMLIFNLYVSMPFFIQVFLLCAEILASELEEEEGGTLARKVGEAVTNTIGVVATAIDIPLGKYCSKIRYSCVRRYGRFKMGSILPPCG